LKAHSIKLPEPLITIWETEEAIRCCCHFFSKDIPVRVKRLSIVNQPFSKPPNAEALMNVNTLEEFEKAKDYWQQHQTL